MERKREQTKKEDKFWLGAEHCRQVREGSPLGQQSNGRVRDLGKRSLKHSAVIYELHVSLRQVSKCWNCFLVSSGCWTVFLRTSRYPNLDHVVHPRMHGVYAVVTSIHHRQLLSPSLLLFIKHVCVQDTA